MQPDKWPNWIEDTLMAKSADRSEGKKPESLAMHTWSALSRLADFIKLRSPLAQQLKQPRLWHCLYWGVFLHDFGKAMPGFQGVLRGDNALKEQWSGHRHEVFSLAFLDWIVDGMNKEERLWTAAAIVSHHKDVKDLQQSYPEPELGEQDMLILEQFDGFPTEHIQGLHRWLLECGWEWAQALNIDTFGVAPVEFVSIPERSFQKDVAKRIRYWMRAYKKLVRKLNLQNDPAVLVPLLTLRGMLINSDHSASAHAHTLPSVTFRAEDVLAKRGIPREALYKHQLKAENRDGSILLTAPTGSGKTEAALLWATHQKHGKYAPPRLFYTLPYQASMNAMLLRLQEIYDDENLVGLQHGRSLLALYRHLMDKNYNPKQAEMEAKWLRNLARLNYPPVRVFSPYQMLKGMYRLKGYEAQLTDYHNALFIFDEIHAYETKRLALILKTIEYLRRYYHARFFVMSATFPTLIKNWLHETLSIGPDDEIKATDILFKKFQRHRLDVIEGELLDPINLEKIIADAHAGKMVLVVCNLVAHAQEAYATLKHLEEDGIRVELLHGRFNSRDRRTKEKLVKDATGSRSDKRQPIVLVATQVVEVSLDIDLNTIYTEPAPLEALIQRFGRVNRRRKIKNLASVHVFTKPDDGQRIYNQRLIKGTLDVLRREHGNPVDESEVGIWLDEIYTGEIAREWKDEFSKTAQEFETAIINTLRPFQSDNALRRLFYEAFDGVDVLPDDDWEKYETLCKQDPLKARELLVSISYGRLRQLKSKRLAWEEEGGWPIVVAVPYSSELGLDFSQI